MSRPHSICLLNDSFPPVIDGVANAVVNYAREIENAGGHAVVATPEVPGADDGAFPFPVMRYPSVDTREMFGYVAGVPFSPELAGRLLKERPEILHSHCPVASTFLARELRETLDIPLVFTYHTKFDIDIANAVRLKFLQREMIDALVWNVSAADEIWVVSRGAGENLRSLGYQGDYIVMDNGVDVPRARASEEAVTSVTAGYDLPAGVPLYLFVGRLMWYKGLRIILDALKRLEEDGRDFRAVFIGGGGDEDEVTAYAEELGLTSRVFFTGPIRDRDAIRAWYTRADLFLFPSTFDTNGLVVREAAASSLASVLIEGSCAAEGVTDGVNGFLIEESAASLAAKLAEIAAEPETARTVGEHAARDLYLSWHDAVARANDRYGTVIDRYLTVGLRREHVRGERFFARQGALMEALAEAEERRRTVHEKIEAFEQTARKRVADFHADVNQRRNDYVSVWNTRLDEANRRINERFDSVVETIDDRADRIDEDFSRRLERDREAVNGSLARVRKLLKL